MVLAPVAPKGRRGAARRDAGPLKRLHARCSPRPRRRALPTREAHPARSMDAPAVARRCRASNSARRRPRDDARGPRRQAVGGTWWTDRARAISKIARAASVAIGATARACPASGGGSASPWRSSGRRIARWPSAGRRAGGGARIATAPSARALWTAARALDRRCPFCAAPRRAARRTCGSASRRRACRSLDPIGIRRLLALGATGGLAPSPRRRRASASFIGRVARRRCRCRRPPRAFGRVRADGRRRPALAARRGHGAAATRAAGAPLAVTTCARTWRRVGARATRRMRAPRARAGSRTSARLAELATSDAAAAGQRRPSMTCAAGRRRTRACEARRPLAKGDLALMTWLLPAPRSTPSPGRRATVRGGGGRAPPPRRRRPWRSCNAATLAAGRDVRRLEGRVWIASVLAARARRGRGHTARMVPARAFRHEAVAARRTAPTSPSPRAAARRRGAFVLVRCSAPRSCRLAAPAADTPHDAAGAAEARRADSASGGAARTRRSHPLAAERARGDRAESCAARRSARRRARRRRRSALHAKAVRDASLARDASCGRRRPSRTSPARRAAAGNVVLGARLALVRPRRLARSTAPASTGRSLSRVAMRARRKRTPAPRASRAEPRAPRRATRAYRGSRWQPTSNRARARSGMAYVAVALRSSRPRAARRDRDSTPARALRAQRRRGRGSCRARAEAISATTTAQKPRRACPRARASRARRPRAVRRQGRLGARRSRAPRARHRRERLGASAARSAAGRRVAAAPAARITASTCLEPRWRRARRGRAPRRERARSAWRCVEARASTGGAAVASGALQRLRVSWRRARASRRRRSRPRAAEPSATTEREESRARKPSAERGGERGERAPRERRRRTIWRGARWPSRGAARDSALGASSVARGRAAAWQWRRGAERAVRHAARTRRCAAKSRHRSTRQCARARGERGRHGRAPPRRRAALGAPRRPRR